MGAPLEGVSLWPALQMIGSHAALDESRAIDLVPSRGAVLGVPCKSHALGWARLASARRRGTLHAALFPPTHAARRGTAAPLDGVSERAARRRFVVAGASGDRAARRASRLRRAGRFFQHDVPGRA